jgi:molybdopterin-guanine dinucleotide biosynthesis protein A
MGRPKPSLPFGDEAMLARILRRLGEVVSPVVVAAAPGQQLPALPASVPIVRDRQEDRGPLEGLAVALAELTGRVERAFVTTCDVPLLVPDFVRRMTELATDHDVAVPRVDGFDEPLSAVYHTRVLPEVEKLLAADRRRPAFLFDLVRTRRVAAEELTDVDPRLDSLFNVNTPADYELALQRAGLKDFKTQD